MFEEALPTAMPLTAWHPDLGEWVALEPCDLVGGDVAPGFWERLGGVLPDEVERTPPGPELAEVLAAFDVDSADGWSLVEAAALVERLAAWVAAKQAVVLTALASRPELQPSGDTGYRSVNPITNTAVEVAGRCQLTARQAEGLVGHAVQLVEDFPDTWAALLAGLIDLRRARVITDELGGQEPGVRRRVEAAVLPRAPFLDSVALRRLIKQLLHELAPVEAAERHAIARESRYVAVTPASDGMAFLEARLPAEDAMALDAALNATAADLRRADARAGGPVRTKDQRRADALAGLGWAALTACAGAASARGRAAPGPAPTGAATPGTSAVGTALGGAAPESAPANAAAGPAPSTTAVFTADGPAPRRRPISVHVTIPFGTLTGLSEEPGELDGYGPIPAQVARTLAAEGVWQWLRTDPGSGQLLDLGRTRYRPSQALADFVAARDRTCRMPSCHRPARAGDIDHLEPFARGGTTCATNCHSLCETHHLLKHHGNWAVTRHPNGTTRWRSPTGHTYERPPERIGRLNGTDPPADPPRY